MPLNNLSFQEGYSFLDLLMMLGNVLSDMLQQCVCILFIPFKYAFVGFESTDSGFMQLMRPI
jgi:hypothetical protein